LWAFLLSNAMDRQKAWGQRQNWHSQHARRSGAVRLGKAGTALRGATLDARLYQEALRRNGRPEAQRGEPCFEVLFAIDANKRLLITVRNLRTMRLVLEDYPVVRLT
jgi:hypothetical protein